MGAGCCSEVDKAGPEHAYGHHHGQPYGAGGGVAPASYPSATLPPEPPKPSAAPAMAQPQASGGPSSRQASKTATGVAAQQPEAFESQVGELPTFDKPRNRGGGFGGSPPRSEVSALDDGASVMSNGSHTSGVSQMVDALQSKEQKQHAKAVVKEFVKAMVKGRKMNVMAPNGNLKSCTVSVTRNLDALKIKADSKTQSIPLKKVEEIHAGTDVEGIETPLDDLCATLMLASENCITFRLNDLEDRDTFVMCLHMFCNNQK